MQNSWSFFFRDYSFFTAPLERAIDGARGPGDLGIARTAAERRRENLFEPRRQIIKKEASTKLPLERAIDGARTRGLDLGKVARYQLRHYRIACLTFISDK